ncbi:hypothetical protein pb186bvf_020431 [Paramecium bursaria]
MQRLIFHVPLGNEHKYILKLGLMKGITFYMGLANLGQYKM